MQYILPTAVFLLMLSVGMSLDRRQIAVSFARISASDTLRLILATFILPPAVALLVARLFSMGPPETLGLFMIGVAPGAPLMTRNIAKKGFDMQIAASYQLWGALLIPIMIPVVVFLAAKLYDRDVWIPPTELIWQIAKQQLLPLLAGMGLMQLMPDFSKKVQRALNVIGNLALSVVLVVMLVKLAPTLLDTVSWWLPVAALILAVSSVAAIRLLLPGNAIVRDTFAICNANRHVGLALLLAGHHFQNINILPSVVCYALVAPFVMGATTKVLRPAPATV